MSRLFQLHKQALPAFFTAIVLAGVVSCSDAVSSSVPTECRVTIEVSGVTATADVIYYDQAGDPMVEIVNDAGAAVPYSQQVTESIDYNSIQNRQVSVTANVDIGETLSLNVYYDEVYEYSPVIRTTLAQESYANPGSVTVNAHTLSTSFVLPVQ